MTNVFDIFFKKFAYKFPKGYPDMNNEQDILLLESLLEKLNVPMYKSASLESLHFPLIEKVANGNLLFIVC